jgi:hypothetical protein
MPTGVASSPRGDVDIAVIGGVLADSGRCRMLLALGDGRLSQLAPATPIVSLRQGLRADALREARTCYDHIAGRLGVDLMASMVCAGHITDADCGRDGAASHNARAGYGHDIDYRLTPHGVCFLREFGVVLPRQAVVRYCLDWSERRHHLAGAPGRGLLERCIALGWIQRSPQSRAVVVTPAGRKGIRELFNVVTPRVEAR